MKVEHELWKERMDNLMARRKDWGHNDDNKHTAKGVGDYCAHLKKVHVGKSVLDVGCGRKFIQSCLPEGVAYTGLDPYPITDDVVFGTIEDCKFPDLSFDTICAFAVMDGCIDFVAAVENMKRMAAVNVVFLTGIGIDPDKYHTHRLLMTDFDSRFTDWKHGYREEIVKNVWLLEYIK